MKPYFTYIIKCNDDTLYTGVTTDIDRRIAEHNESPRGAKYTRTRRPVELIHSEEYASRSDACKREYAIKQMKREEKLNMIGKF